MWSRFLVPIFFFNLDIYYHVTTALTPNFVLFRGNEPQHMGMWKREIQCPLFQGMTLAWDDLRMRCGWYPQIQLQMDLFLVPSLRLPTWCEVAISNLRKKKRWKIQKQNGENVVKNVPKSQDFENVPVKINLNELIICSMGLFCSVQSYFYWGIIMSW